MSAIARLDAIDKVCNRLRSRRPTKIEHHLRHGSCVAEPMPLRSRRSLIAAIPIVFLPAVAAQAQNPAVTISVDVAANRHAINANIYGVAHATTAQLNDLNTPLNRNGGNNTTRYNWQLNADNRGSDWYFESIGDSSATAGERGDSFFANSRAANAQPMLTIPMVDWVAKMGSNRSKLAGFSIAKYGAQTGNDRQWFADAGNGVLADGRNVAGNDPNDANVPSSSVFQQGWVQHLVTRWAPRRTTVCGTTFSTTNPACGTAPIAIYIRLAPPWTKSGAG